MIENSRVDGGYVLNFRGLRIRFHVEYRKRKKLAITVHPELRLEVVAPVGSTSDQVLQRVEKRAGWILRQWRYFERFQPTHPGPRTGDHATCDDPAMGKLYKGRQNLAEPGTREGPGALHRLRDRPRTVPPQGSQPRKGLLPPSGPLHAGLGGQEEAA